MPSTPLIVIGAVLQGSGFYLALREAIRTRRREIPEQPALHQRAATYVGRRVELTLIRLRLRKGKVATLSASGALRFGGDLRATVRHSRAGQPVEDRLAALEDEVQEHRETQQTELRELAEKAEAIRSDVEAVKTELEGERKARLVRSITREEIGIYLFIVGLAISTAGALIA